MMNKTAAELLSPAITNTHDALHLLSEAAGRTEDLNRQQLEYSYAANQSSSSNFTPTSVSPMGQAGTPGKVSRSNSSNHHGGAPVGWYQQGKDSKNMDIVAEVADAVLSPPKPPEDVGYAKARRAWSRLRFIRAGWFSVDEAMAYIT